MEKQIVEINGTKFEVDLTKARRVTEFKIGQPVKVLVKNYGDQYSTHPGVIVGFDAFEQLPSIQLAYLKIGYGSVDMEYVTFNASTKDIEICAVTHDGDIAMRKSQVIEKMEKEIAKKRLEVEEAELKLSHFLTRFGEYFKVEEAKADAAEVQ